MIWVKKVNRWSGKTVKNTRNRTSLFCAGAACFGVAARFAILVLLIGSKQLYADARPLSAVIGSTEQEIEAALGLCSEYEEGCEREWYEDEAVRTQALKPYRLDAMEVSIADFKRYVERFSVKTDAEIRLQTVVTDAQNPMAGYYTDDTFWFNAYPAGDSSFPVVHVTLRDAANYCSAQGKRLPTEAEWEYAARGPERHRFPWGDDWGDHARYRGSEFPHKSPRPIGSYEATARGYYDLSGSVSEWTVTTEGDSVVVKGGFRYSRNVANLRAAVRRLEDPAYSGDDIGFRCAQTLDEWPVDPAGIALADSQSESKTQEDKLRIESLLDSARKLSQLQKYDLAIAELDRADAIDSKEASTGALREEIRARRDSVIIAGDAPAGTEATEEVSNVAVAEELINRVKVKRKVRERNQVLFSEYLNNDLAEAMVRLFERER